MKLARLGSLRRWQFIIRRKRINTEWRMRIWLFRYSIYLFWYITVYCWCSIYNSLLLVFWYITVYCWCSALKTADVTTMYYNVCYIDLAVCICCWLW